MLPQKPLSWGKAPSSIRELAEYGAKRKAEIGPENVFDFSLGNPNVPPPSLVDESIIDIISSKTPNIHGYTTAAGIASLREKIAANLMDIYGLKADPELIYVTCGAAAGIAASLNAILEPHDEVLTLAPYFPEYDVFTDGAGGILRSASMTPDFHVDPLALEKVIGPKTRAMIINSPNNPTGILLTRKDIETIADILKKHAAINKRAIYLISDEPYRELVYDNLKVPSVLDIYADSIMCYSFSKSLSIPGERIGYVLVNRQASEARDLYASIKGAARSLGYVNPPSLFQRVVERCIGKTSDISQYVKNRDLLCEGLSKIGYDFVHPDGAFYLFTKALEPDAKAFSNKAKEHELLLVPSDDFGYPGYVRISYCVSLSVIINSMPHFKALYDEYNS